MPDVASSEPISSSSVLIVGAGPVGLAAAAELARRGVRPRVVDSLPAPSEQPRAVIVHSRTQDLVERIGALPGMLRGAEPQRFIQISTVKATSEKTLRTLARFDLGHLPGRHRNMLSIPQPRTEAALRECVNQLGVQVERDVTLTDLHQTAEAVAVTLTGPTGEERATFDWVIGADGARSSVRRLVGAHLDRSSEASWFVIADVLASTDLPPDTTQLFVGRTVSIMLPMRDGRYRLIFQVDEPEGGGDSAPTIDQLRDLVRIDMAGALTVDSAPWTSFYNIRHGQVPQYRAGRVFLAGDAAHIHSPAGGQGLNTGLQDAGNLAWKLALVCRGLAEPVLLDSYQSERHPVGAAVVRNTAKLTEIMTARGAVGAVRNAALWSIGHHAWSADKLATQLAELNIAYPRSPIVSAGAGSEGLAGQYAPDVVLRDANGADVAIADLLTGPGHVLLVVSTDPGLIDQFGHAVGELGRVVPVATAPHDAVSGTFVDPDQQLRSELGLFDGGVALIRPDGYLGYVNSRETSPSELAAYISRAVTSRPARQPSQTS